MRPWCAGGPETRSTRHRTRTVRTAQGAGDAHRQDRVCCQIRCWSNVQRNHLGEFSQALSHSGARLRGVAGRTLRALGGTSGARVRIVVQPSNAGSAAGRSRSRRRTLGGGCGDTARVRSGPVRSDGLAARRSGRGSRGGGACGSRETGEGGEGEDEDDAELLHEGTFRGCAGRSGTPQMVPGHVYGAMTKPSLHQTRRALLLRQVGGGRGTAPRMPAAASARA